MTPATQTKILLTGPPGCGKTTLVVKLSRLLQGKRLAGFYTQEIREDGRRTGFQAKTFQGKEALLSSVHHKSWISVGRYGVDIHGFEALVLPELEKAPDTVDLYLLDEIGKMECASPLFVEDVMNLLARDVPLVATVSQRGKGLIEEIKARTDIELVTVTPHNRNDLPGVILAQLDAPSRD